MLRLADQSPFTFFHFQSSISINLHLHSSISNLHFHSPFPRISTDLHLLFVLGSYSYVTQSMTIGLLQISSILSQNTTNCVKMATHYISPNPSRPHVLMSTCREERGERGDRRGERREERERKRDREREESEKES